MYRLALNKTAARSSVRYAAAARASARIVSTRPAARSYSSGHSSQQEESSPFKIVTYIAPTVLALAAYYGIVEIPNNRAKAAKQAAKQQQQEETAPAAEEFVSEPEPSQSEPEALPQTPVEATSDSELPAAATTESETVSEDPLPEVAKESIDLLSADLEEAIKEGAIHEKEPVEDAAAVEATDAAQAGAFNPDTGEINWDCPCLGGMANGPCGEEFKTAFSCFVYSEAEPKGVDCIEKFSAMQDCFRRHPDVYAEELTDAQPFADENNQGIVAAEEAVAVTESSEPASAPSEVAETAAQPEPEATTPTETVKEDN